MVAIDENRRKLGPEALFEAVVVRALLDAFFLKKEISYGEKGYVKNGYNVAKKAEAVSWLKGENDYEGLDFVCTAAGIPTEKLVAKSREWFCGENSGGYELRTKADMKKILGFDIRIVEKD